MMPYEITLSKDIHSLSGFRANATSVIEKVKQEKGRVAVITQNGKAAAVIMGVAFFEELEAATSFVAKEPSTLYESTDIMEKELYQKIEKLSKEEQERLSHLIDNLLAPVSAPEELPALSLGGRLDQKNIRQLAREE